MTVTHACSSCGAEVVAGDAFCEACGADLPAAVAGAPAPAPPATSVPNAPQAAPMPACPACGAGPASIADGYCGECGIKRPAPRDHLEGTGAGVAAVTDRGRRHHRNEDAFAFAVGEDGAVRAVVCDGVSTSVNPDEASLRATDRAREGLAPAPADPAPADDARHARAYEAARTAVLAVAWEPQPGLGPPSCTYLAATVEGAVAELANLGDCRAYWLPAEGAPSCLTADDSWAREQLDAGVLTEEAAYADPRAHSITRWLASDADPSWTPRRTRFEAPAAGRLLLCSDGLWNYALRPEQVAEAAGTGDLLDVARRLVDHANAAGGSDNITVVVIDLPRAGPGGADSTKGPTA